MEKETGYKRHELLKWSVNEFHYNIVYLAWQQKAVKEYNKIKERALNGPKK